MFLKSLLHRIKSFLHLAIGLMMVSSASAIMNWLLIKKEYPMFFIPFEKREEYYMTLEEADKENSKEYVARMLRLIIDQVRSYGHKNKKE